MKYEEARKIVEKACGFEKKTMDYFHSYIYREPMMIKLAEAMIEKKGGEVDG